MKTKHWVARLLSCILTICLLSTVAFAAEVTAYVAEVNGMEYETLQEALNAASNGDTVKLLTNVDAASNIWMNISGVTLDLDNYTITAQNQCAICVENGVTATVTNGFLTGGSFSTVYNCGNVTLDNVEVVSGSYVEATDENGDVVVVSYGGGVWDYGTKSSVTIKNCVVTGEYFAVYHNGSTAGFTLTAENSTITGNSDTACAIYVSGNSTNTAEDNDGMNTITLTNCTVTGPTGVEGKYTNMKLTDCDITATAEQSSFEQYNNGSTALGFAVVSTDNSISPASPTPSATITINGGTYEGLVGLSNLISTEEYADFAEANIIVTSGTFSNDVSAYLADETSDVEYNTVLKVPTCTENGIGKRITVVDGKQSISYYVIAAAHKPGEAVVEKEVSATCEETGSYESVVYCSVCGEELSRETVTVEALGHTEPEEGVETILATCAEDGSKTYTCTVCNEEVTEVIPATGEHSWKKSEYVKVTCTENGKAGGQICSVCGAENPEDPPEDLGDVDPAKGHTWELDEEAEDYQAGTCVEEGTGVYVCAVCGETKTEVIPATGIHTEEVVEAVEPTCGKAGHTDGVQCSVCDEILYGMEEIPATGEHIEEVIEGTPATCQEAGLTDGVKCAVCSEVLVAQEEIPVDPDAHDYEVTVLKAATCTTTGVGKYVCKDCGTSKYAAISATHEWDEGTVTTLATCTEAGVMTYTCTVCSETYTEEIPADHSWDEGEVTTKGTCGTDGEMTYTCSVCGDSYTETIPATGEHNFVEDSVKDATCTEPAMVGSICTICGQSNGELTPVGEPAGHRYEEEVTEEATCVQDGEITYTCSVCGDSYTETIPATGEHEDTFMEAKAPTCVEDGYTEGVQCSVCDEILYGMEAIPATGEHTEEVIEGTPATCQEAGLTDGVKCAVCREILVAQDEIPVDPDAHNYEVTPLKAATCTTTGIGKYVCSICGDYYYATLEASHTWGEPTINKAATCNEEGEQTYTCTECDETKTEIIPATGEHNYVEDVVPATCTENAKVGFVCSVCGAVDPDREAVEVPDSMIDHDYEIETIETTCTEAGSVTKTCKVCGDVEVEEIPAAGHTAGESHYEAATCTENGKDVIRCAVCGEILEEHDMGEMDPATGHTEEILPAVPATCGATGLTEGVKCAVCGEILVAQEETPIDETAHEYEVTALKAATCSTTGIGKYVCAICGDSYYGVIETIPHTFDEENAEVTQDATCTEEGILTVTCTVCNATEERPIEALGHVWGEEQVSEDNTYIYKECSRCHETEIIAWIECRHEETEIRNAKEASCTETGYTGDTYCVTCGELISGGEEIAKTEHSEVVIEGQAATCTESGLTDGVKCSVCDEILMAQEEISATGHSWDEGVVTIEPTEETEGKIVYTCAVCEETKTEDIPALEHEHSYTAVVTEPTCTEKGYTTYTCQCGESYVADEVDELGHTPGEPVKEKEIPATETEEGSYDEVVYCTVCGNELSREPKTTPILEPACKHENVEIVGEKEATCTEVGYTGDKVCADCGKVIEEGTEIEALGHDLVEDVAVAATCTTAGKEAGKHCTRCDYTEGGEAIEALGHTSAEAIHENEVAATCKAEGSYDEVVKCSVCGVEISRATKTVEKLAHTEEIIPGKAATCTEAGKTEGKKCSVCGEIIVAQTEIAALGHGSTEIRGAKDATCDEAGYTGDTYCAVCGEKISSGETIPAAGHSYTKSYSFNDDYTERIITYTCTKCSHSYQETEKVD